MTRIAVFDTWNCRSFFRLTACSIDCNDQKHSPAWPVRIHEWPLRLVFGHEQFPPMWCTIEQRRAVRRSLRSPGTVSCYGWHRRAV
jgi:hypothetical protein